jgi:hypothetical protein
MRCSALTSSQQTLAHTEFLQCLQGIRGQPDASSVTPSLFALENLCFDTVLAKCCAESETRHPSSEDDGRQRLHASQGTARPTISSSAQRCGEARDPCKGKARKRMRSDNAGSRVRGPPRQGLFVIPSRGYFDGSTSA